MVLKDRVFDPAKQKQAEEEQERKELLRLEKMDGEKEPPKKKGWPWIASSAVVVVLLLLGLFVWPGWAKGKPSQGTIATQPAPVPQINQGYGQPQPQQLPAAVPIETTRDEPNMAQEAMTADEFWLMVWETTMRRKDETLKGKTFLISGTAIGTGWSEGDPSSAVTRLSLEKDGSVAIEFQVDEKYFTKAKNIRPLQQIIIEGEYVESSVLGVNNFGSRGQGVLLKNSRIIKVSPRASPKYR